MASYTTNLNLKKPAGSENVSIGDINGNMDAIDTAVGTLQDRSKCYNFGNKTPSDAESAFLTLAASMATTDYQPIKIAFTSATDYVANATYVGFIYKNTTEKVTVELHTASTSVINKRHAVATYRDGAWAWDNLAVKSDVDAVDGRFYSVGSISSSTSKTITFNTSITRFLLFVSSSASTREALCMCVGQTANCYVTEIYKGSAITVDNSTQGKITISSSNSNGSVAYMLVFAGSSDNFTITST